MCFTIREDSGELILPRESAREVPSLPMCRLRKSLIASAPSDSLVQMRFAVEASDDGTRTSQTKLRYFIHFLLKRFVPDDHMVRKVAAVLHLSWLHAELAPHLSQQWSTLD